MKNNSCADEMNNSSIGMTDKEILMAFNKALANKKTVIRPKFSLKRECIQIAAAVALWSALLFVTIKFNVDLPDKFSIPVFICITLIILTSQLKNIFLLSIYLYQKFAPQFIRSSCLFQPSCSEYMRISIIKYGVLKGVKKGFGRIRRCHPQNGGIDEP